MFFRILIIIVAFSLTSCQKQGDQSPNQQQLRLNIFTEPPTLDSRKATDATSMNVIHMLFDGLTRIGPDEVPHPSVAERITQSDDGLIYTFHLKKTYWTDGSPVTAEDFAYAWKKILDPSFPALFADKLYPIVNAREIKEGKLPLDSLGVKVIDPQTLQVKLKHPTPYFLELTAFPTYYPIQSKIDIQHPNWVDAAGETFVSNGPFKLKKWDHENEIVLEKNPTYWDSPAVKLAQLHLAMIDDSITEYYMYEAGEIDWAGFPTSNLPPDILPQLIASGRAGYYDCLGTYYYKINTDVFPFNNVHIRRAFLYALNRGDIVKHVTQAKQAPALSLVPPMIHREKPLVLFRDNDKEKARASFKKGLEELGLEPGSFPKITLSYNSNREHQKIAQAVQNQWLEVLGVQVELEHCDWKVYLNKVNKQNYMIARMGWLADYSDPVSFLTPFKYRDDPEIGGQNETGWESPRYIALLDQSDHELDPKKREDLLKQAEALLISEAPILPVYFLKCWYLKKPYVKGVNISPLGISDYKEAYIE